jgi:hypothetical protein
VGTALKQFLSSMFQHGEQRRGGKVSEHILPLLLYDFAIVAIAQYHGTE